MLLYAILKRVKAYNSLLDQIRLTVRSGMRVIAAGLNAFTRGKVHPNAITLIALAAHVPVAWLISTSDYNVLAAVLLLFFGLFDALDGELARLQGRASRFGMLLDSIADRIKEIILYIGIVSVFAYSNNPAGAVWAVAACGVSVLVSYVNAWGEVVMAGADIGDHEVNRSFRNGLMGYDTRMAVLIIGLLSNQLIVAVAAIALLSSFTAFGRITSISRRLQ